MTTATPLLCPFCHTELTKRDAVCKGCSARRHVRSGMSLQGFRWYVASWLVLSVPLMALTLFVALLPWLPHGETPGYAMTLVGARPIEGAPRCRVELVDAAGTRTEAVLESACGSQATAAESSSAVQEASPALRRMAAAGHSTLGLVTGSLLCWGLLYALRRLFLLRSSPSWVRRANA